MMTFVTIPPRSQLTEAEFRNWLFGTAQERLQHMAWRQMNVFGKSNTDVAAVVIEVDSKWRWIVDMLMPKKNWDEIRAAGAEPFARGIVEYETVVALTAREFPELRDIAREKPPEGKLKAICLSEGGCTIYDLEPKQAEHA